MARRSAQTLLALLESRSAVQLGDLRAALGGASRATTFRYLEQLPYRSSYDHNGRFYTLHEPSKYDRWGLRSVGGAHFSVDGTLKATVVRLVRESEAGWTQRELQDLLRVRVQLFLLAALRQGAVGREALGRLFVYLHPEAAVGEAQLARRRERATAPAPATLVDAEVTIRVLLVLLGHPGSGPGDVVRRLQGRAPPVSRAQVDHVFAQYGLGEKGGPRMY